MANAEHKAMGPGGTAKDPVKGDQGSLGHRAYETWRELGWLSLLMKTLRMNLTAATTARSSVKRG